MSFFGVIVKPSKPTAFVPPPEDWNLHLSQASLPASVKEGTRVSLLVRHSDGEDPIVLCTLTAGRQDTGILDLFFSQYAEFTVDGPCEVHLSGYYTPAQPLALADDGDADEDEEGFGDDEDEDESHDEDGMDYDSNRLQVIDSDDEDDDEDGEFDEDEDDASDEDEPMFGFPQSRKPHVVIEELDENAEAADTEKQKQQTTKAAPKGPAKSSHPVSGQTKPAPEKAQKADKADKPDRLPKEPAAVQPAAKADKRPDPSGPEEQPGSKKQATDKKDSGSQHAQRKDDAAARVATNKKNIRRWENGFEIEDLHLGPPSGKLAKAGKKVVVKYVGRLKSNGKVFDKSTKPFTFRLGVGEVVKGWDLGVEGMRVGDKRRLCIPPQLAYGSSGVKGAIPPNATLEFEVELVDVK